MLAPFATFAFLAALWLANLVLADLFGHGLGKISAALKGRSMLAAAQPMPPIAARVSQRSHPLPAMRAEPRFSAELRAAA